MSKYETAAPIDLEKLDNDAGELVQTIFNSIKKSKVETQRVKTQVEQLGKLAKELREPLVRFYNAYLSIVDGLAIDDLSPTEAKRSLEKDAHDFMAALSSLTEEKTRADDSYKNRELLSKQFLRQAANNKNQLQTALIKKGVFVGYAPIIPLTKPNLVVEELVKRGIKARMYEGYPLLEKQLVAGISFDRQGRLLDPNDHQPVKVLPKAKKAQQEEEFLKDFVASVKAKFPSHRLVEVGKPATWWSATWFWLVPEKELDAIRKATFGGGSSLIVTKWGFAFHGSGK